MAEKNENLDTNKPLGATDSQPSQTVVQDKKEEPTKKKDEKKASVLDEFIASKPELTRYSMTQGFRMFCSRNFKAFKELKTKEDCEQAFNKYYNSVGK